MLALPGADHAIKFFKLIEFHCSVAHDSSPIIACSSGVQLADTLLQRSGDTHAIFVGNALMRSVGCVLACPKARSPARR